MKDLTRGSEAKLIVFFALPMLIGNVFQQFYNMVDSWVVGRYVGTEALAAVGVAFPIIFLMVALVMGLAMGSNVLIAQYYGAKDLRRVRAAIDTAYIVTFAASAILTVAALIGTVPLLRLLRVPPSVMPEATVYLRIIFGGMILSFGYNGVSAILRGLGDSMTPLFMLIVATILNIILDLVFVRVFGWGVAGVAWATIISQGISFVGSVLYLNKTHELLKTNFLKLKFDRDIFNLSLKIGIPSGAQQTLVSLGLMFMSAVVNGFGANVMAGFTAGSRIDSFVGMPAMNVSMALSTFVGQNLGAGRPDRARRGYRAALLIGIGITAFLCSLLLLFGRQLVGIFTTDAEVVALGARYLTIIAPFYFAFTIMFITNGLIRGSGEAVVPMLSTLLAMWLIRVPSAVLLSGLWGTDGIWWAMPTGWVVGMFVALGYYRTGRWTKKAVVNPADRAAAAVAGE